MAENSKKTAAKSYSLNRRKFLNLIYFVDSNRTRSSKIPLRVVFYALVATITIGIWTIAGSFWLFRSLKDNLALYENKSDLLSVIFDYQVRFENVYENAYPKSHQFEDLPSQAPNKSTTLLTENAGDPSSTKPTEIKSIDPQVGNSSQINVSTSSNTTATSDAPIAIEDLEWSTNSTELSLNFSIRNKNSPEKINGHIWAVATFKYKEKEKDDQFIYSPTGLERHDHDYISNNLRNTERFGIRYHKAKHLIFNAPDTEGNFVEVRLYCLMNETIYELKSISISKNADLNELAKSRHIQMQQVAE